jgi:hypothetical protein
MWDGGWQGVGTKVGWRRFIDFGAVVVEVGGEQLQILAPRPDAGHVMRSQQIRFRVSFVGC